MSDKQYDNTNRGVLFVNDRKEKDSHPDRKGSINVEGKEYWLSGWIKQGANGQFLSLSVQPKEEKKDWIKPELREKFKQEEVVLDDIDDEPIDMSKIPF